MNDSSIGEPTIPNCEHCNSKRVFELQILPTLFSLENGNAVKLIQNLNKPRIKFQKKEDPNNSNNASVEFEESGIEFGTVCVFTCSNSCTSPTSPDYRKEFVFVQSAI